MRRIVLAVFAAALMFIAPAAPSAAGGCVNTTRPVEGTSPDVRITSGDPWLVTAVLASILVGVTSFAAGRYLGR